MWFSLLLRNIADPSALGLSQEKTREAHKMILKSLDIRTKSSRTIAQNVLSVEFSRFHGEKSIQVSFSLAISVISNSIAN